MNETPEVEPFVRVVAGDPTAEELAALVAVLAARRGSNTQPAAPDVRRSAWSSPARLTRDNLPHGPGGWRASGFPR